VLVKLEIVIATKALPVLGGGRAYVERERNKAEERDEEQIGCQKYDRAPSPHLSRSRARGNRDPREFARNARPSTPAEFMHAHKPEHLARARDARLPVCPDFHCEAGYRRVPGFLARDGLRDGADGGLTPANPE